MIVEKKRRRREGVILFSEIKLIKKG